MRQLTLATVNFDKHYKQTRRAAFLAEMECVVPWHELCAEIEPFYPKRGLAARRSDWSVCCGCPAALVQLI